MGLKALLNKFAEKKQRFRELEEEDRFHETLATRKKSPHERELENFLEDERQKKIKNAVNKFRKKENDKFWRAGMMNKTNIFKGHNNILQSRKTFQLKGNLLKRGSL